MTTKKIQTDKYVCLLVSIGILVWNLSLYYLENPVLQVIVAVIALFFGVRVWLLFFRNFYSPIDDMPDRYVETAVIMIFFITGLIQTFDGHFDDWFRVLTFAVIGLIAGMNLKQIRKSQKSK